MSKRSFKQFFSEECGLRHSDEERELPYDPEAIKRSRDRAQFPEITISEQDLEDALNNEEKSLPNGKSLLKRFTLAIAHGDGTYTLKQTPDRTMLSAENAERGDYTLELGGKEWDVIEVVKLYTTAPFPADGSGKKFAGALIKVAEV